MGRFYGEVLVIKASFADIMPLVKPLITTEEERENRRKDRQRRERERERERDEKTG